MGGKRAPRVEKDAARKGTPRSKTDFNEGYPFDPGTFELTIKLKRTDRQTDSECGIVRKARHALPKVNQLK